MRLDRLDLTRYGRFTDHVLDFGTVTPGQPDLHIVHGPNEAGKSTLLSAWLDLLFGIHARSSYNFIHDYNAMQIGAAMSLPSGAQQIIRTKGTRNTLTDAAGQPLPESLLHAALGGLDRTASADMFALDAESMEKGGDQILSSQGDLGELLFSATAGLSDLSRRLSVLRTEGNEFWKKGGRSGKLKALRTALGELDTERRALDVQAPEYARRRGAADKTRAERDRLLMQSAAAAEARDRAKAKLEALPLLASYHAVKAETLPLAALPEAPAEWAARVAALRLSQADLSAQTRLNAERVQQLQAKLDGLVPDDTALAQADAPGFDENLKAAFLSGRVDLPRRRESLALLDDRLAELSETTGGAASEPGLDAATLDALDRLASDHGALAERLRNASDEMRQAAEALDLAGGALDDDAADTTPTALRAALVPLRTADLAARLDSATAEANEAAARRDGALARLAPWSGDLATLRALSVPPSDRLAAWRDQLATAKRTHNDALRAVAERQADARRRAAERDALAAALGEAAPETVARARADRDAAWSAHRATLDVTSADRFAAAMAAHDRATETQLAEAADLGRLRALTVDAATAAKLADDANSAGSQTADALAASRADLAARLAFLPNRDPEDPVAGVADWLTARAQALDLADAAEVALRSAERIRTDVTRTQAGLAAALGLEGDLPALAAEAQARLDRLDAETARRADRRRLTAALAQRQRSVATAQQALDAWSADLAEVLAATPLAGDPPTPARLRALLPALRDRAQAFREAADLRHRIATMEADARRFTEAVASLAAALSLPDGEPLAQQAEAAVRLDRARRIADSRAATAADLEDATAAAATLALAQSRLTAESAEITTHLVAADLAEAETLLAQITRRDQLRRDAGAIATQLQGLLGVASLDEAVTALADSTTETLRDALARAEADREDTEAQLDHARHALFEADQALNAVSGDERVALIEARRQTLLLTIEDEARAWVRQRAGVLATQQALDVYRHTHRGQMMARASDTFAAITGGAYVGLTTQPGEDGTERLIALSAEGGSRTPKALSKGTRFQLYLALRIAGFHEWIGAHGPVPVIADDIMETFDDTRTHLALKALAEMSRSGQVIYLTHHRHVCDLARAACPEARIVEL